MYDLDTYLQWCTEMGKDPLLPPYFDLFLDDVLYSSLQIAKATGMHKETALRWFRNLDLINESASNRFKARGKAIKQLLFNRPNIINPLKKKYPDFFCLIK